jgi:CheY-like chemotaxis protein
LQTGHDAPSAKLVVMIDDDAVVLDGMAGLLRSWGYAVVAAATDDAAQAGLAQLGRRPDLIISDYRLAEGKTGVEAIERLRGGSEIPALLITGEAAPTLPPDVRAGRYHLLHKPVDPTALLGLLSRMFRREDWFLGGK